MLAGAVAILSKSYYSIDHDPAGYFTGVPPMGNHQIEENSLIICAKLVSGQIFLRVHRVAIATNFKMQHDPISARATDLSDTLSDSNSILLFHE